MADNLFALQAYEAIAQKDQTPTLSRGHGKMNMQQMRKVAQDFEAVFVSQMMKPMFENTIAEAPFGGGNSEKIWRDMQIDEYGKAIAKSGGIGIADSIMQEMIKMQETR